MTETTITPDTTARGKIMLIGIGVWMCLRHSLRLF